jgi:hypothetical protein
MVSSVDFVLFFCRCSNFAWLESSWLSCVLTGVPYACLPLKRKKFLIEFLDAKPPKSFPSLPKVKFLAILRQTGLSTSDEMRR